jgi:two-component system cell cycle sensor histidine kinase/response regulator CckA
MYTPVQLLLVDDHAENLVALESILNRPDYRITRAQFAQNALLSLLTTDFALVVLDVHMPEISGLELARMIKERPKTRDIPIIFLTAHDREEQQVLTGYKAGAVDYVTKPVNPAVLRSKVAVFVELHRKNQELRETVKSLRESELKFRQLAENASEVFWLANNDISEILYVSPAYEKVWGRSCRNLHERHMSFAQSIHPTDQQRILGGLEKLKRAEVYDEELRIIRPDGSVRWIRDRRFPVCNEHEEFYRVAGFIEDITERKSAEERLAVEHAVTRALAELVAVPDTSKKILQIFCQSFQWDIGELWLVDPASHVLRCIEIWYPPSAEFKEFASSRRQMTFSPRIGLVGQIWAGNQVTWIPDFGQGPNSVRAEIPPRLGLHSAFGFPIQFHGEILGVLNFFSAEIRQPDTDSMATLTALGGQIGSLIARKNLADQLRQAQKMEAFGQLAGGVAHDFNNILAVIMGYTSLLLEHGNLNVDIKDQLAEIYSAGERAANLTRQLLTFSRKRQMTVSLLDLNEVVSSMTKMLRRIIGENINLQCSLSPDLPAVEADEGMVEQILMNLVVNARDAMPGGGQLIISTRPVATDSAYFQGNPDARVREFVCLSIQDMGCGMSPEIKARIFEPFFTTKNEGKGTGLGLATVHGIVKQHQGWIEVESQVGVGTTFKIFLPASTRSAATDEHTTREFQTCSGHETILLVEDDEAVRDLTKIVLERYGYRVLEAESSEETLSLWNAHDREIDLLLTDVNMPGGLTGVELAQQLRARKSNLKVIYSSGYIKDPEEAMFKTRETAPFLQKPYHPQRLVQTVRDCLDSTA